MNHVEDIHVKNSEMLVGTFGVAEQLEWTSVV